MDLDLKGRVAIVTGGSRGIGKAIARALAREGADVALIARNLKDAEAAAAEIAAESGRTVRAYAADTGDDAAVHAAFERIIADFTRLDVLVNAAAQPGGQAPPPKLAEVTNDNFWSDVNVKVMGYVRCAREAAPHMAKHGWGRIINISGLAARQTGSIFGSIRNVAVSAMTKNLADELGPHGINVTVVHPGATRTERTTPELAARPTGNAIERMVEAHEVAYVVAFLASPKSIGITGDAIACGGGARGAIHY